MKMINHIYEENSGVTVVTLADKNGRYEGTAFVHPNDRVFASRYAGGRLAEQRAWIKALKSERRRTKIMLKAIENLNKDINYTCGNIDPKIQKRINLKLRDYNKTINFLTDEINAINEEIKMSIQVRDNIIKRSKVNK